MSDGLATAGSGGQVMARKESWLLALAMACAPSAAHAAKIPAFFGYGDKVELIERLPDADDYLLNGEHVDLGYHYTEYRLFFMPVAVQSGDRPFVLYTGGDSPRNYVELDEQGRKMLSDMTGRDAIASYGFNPWSHIWSAYLLGSALLGVFLLKLRSMDRQPGGQKPA